MTAIQAIERVDAARQNPIPTSQKLHWLSLLDSELRRSLLEPCETGEDFAGRGADTETATEESTLLFEGDFEQLYFCWLASQIDLALGELDRYAADSALFNSLRGELAAHFRRRYLPKENRKLRW